MGQPTRGPPSPTENCSADKTAPPDPRSCSADAPPARAIQPNKTCGAIPMQLPARADALSYTELPLSAPPWWCGAAAAGAACVNSGARVLRSAGDSSFFQPNSSPGWWQQMSTPIASCTKRSTPAAMRMREMPIADVMKFVHRAVKKGLRREGERGTGVSRGFDLHYVEMVAAQSARARTQRGSSHPCTRGRPR